MTRSTQVAVAAFVLVAAAGAADAADIRAKPGLRGLVRALEKAMPGDRILVTRGVRGDVHVTTPGVTIDLRARGSITGNVTVDADGVTLRGARLKHARVVANGESFVLAKSRLFKSSVAVTGDDALVSANRIDGRGEVDCAVSVAGNGAIVEGNDVVRCGDGVRVIGGNALVNGNDMKGLEGTPFLVEGDGAGVTANSIQDAPAGIVVVGDAAIVDGNIGTQGVSVDGDAAKVTSNDVLQILVDGHGATVDGNATQGSVIVEGSGAEISDNTVQMMLGSGIVAIGDDADVTGNDVHLGAFCGFGGGPDQAGIAVFGDGGHVADNDVQGDFDGGAAVRVDGDANVVEGNTVHDADEAYAVVMTGDDNVAADNEVTDVDGEGLVLDGENGLVLDTHVRGISSCGFLLLGTTTIENCSAVDCAMGIVNLAGGTKIVGSNVSGNAPYDLVDLGGATTDGSFLGGIANDPAAFPEFADLLITGLAPVLPPDVTVVAPAPFTK